MNTETRPLTAVQPGAREPARRDFSRAELSIGIVVPIYNEAEMAEAAFERLQRVGGACPVIVVDGGSTDRSAEIGQRFFRTERRQPPNRGAQLNHGARLLPSDVFLFLHADSKLPESFDEHIRKALGDPRVAAGCFQLRFDVETPMLRFYCWFTQFPGRFLHFGDQAFFVRRETFQAMGGFRELPFLEDVDFLRRLRRQGRFAILPAAVTTSARRFLKRGVVLQQLWNILIVTLFELGIPARRLARLYPHIR